MRDAVGRGGGRLRPFAALPVAAALVLGALLPGCDFDAEASTQVGSAAPEYEARTMDGEPLALDDLRGSAVLLNLWATWCPPCRWEMPHLQALHEEFHADGLRVVGVSVDSQGSDRQVRQFVEELGVDFLILRDPAERVLRVFQGYGLPITFLIDGEGIIRWRHMGPVTSDDPELRRVLTETLSALRAS